MELRIPRHKVIIIIIIYVSNSLRLSTMNKTFFISEKAPQNEEREKVIKIHISCLCEINASFNAKCD